MGRVANSGPEKLSSIVRSVSMNHEARDNNQRSAQNTPVSWDTHGTRPKSRDSNHRNPPRENREPQRDKDSRESQRERIERYGSIGRQQHSRNESGGTGNGSGGEYGESHNPSNGGRRHDYDVQSMETALSSPRASITKNPIPAPTVTVRSEYPTLSRSRQQQSLTCLVTIEVPEGKWSPDPADLRGAPTPPAQQDTSAFSRSKSPEPSRSAEWPGEAPEALEEITEDLHGRVDNWHGLDFSRYGPRDPSRTDPLLIYCRFGKLRLYGTVRVGKDRQSWQELECFLFAEMLICVKEKKGAIPQYAEGNPRRKLTRCTLKGSILIKKHLKHVESNPGQSLVPLGSEMS